MRTLPFTGASGALALVPAPFTYYRGFRLRETAGAIATIVVWDNASAASGTILDEIQFTALESVRETYSPPQVAKNGIYLQVVAGTVAGSILVD